MSNTQQVFPTEGHVIVEVQRDDDNEGIIRYIDFQNVESVRFHDAIGARAICIPYVGVVFDAFGHKYVSMRHQDIVAVVTDVIASDD